MSDVRLVQLAGMGVGISIGYPLDTDTPGYANENLTKVRTCGYTLAHAFKRV